MLIISKSLFNATFPLKCDNNAFCFYILVPAVCAGAPDCEALNRDLCGEVENTCGPCFEGFITNGTDGFSNDPCFGKHNSSSFVCIVCVIVLTKGQEVL